MRNLLLEMELKRRNLEFQYVPDLAVSKIDMASAGLEQIRLTTVFHDDLLVAYDLKMGDGYEFPAIVIFKPRQPGGLYAMGDGYHRTKVRLTRGIKTCDAYVVDTDDPMIIELLRRTLNNVLNGGRNNVEESLIHAMRLIERGFEVRIAAAEMGVTFSLLQERRRQQDVQRRIERLRLIRGDLPWTTLTLLNALQSDRQFAAALEFARSATLTREETRPLIAELKRVHDDPAADGVLARWRTTHADRLQRRAAGIMQESLPAQAVDRTRRLVQFIARSDLATPVLEREPAARLAAMAKEIRKAILLLTKLAKAYEDAAARKIRPRSSNHAAR